MVSEELILRRKYTKNVNMNVKLKVWNKSKWVSMTLKSINQSIVVNVNKTQNKTETVFF